MMGDLTVRSDVGKGSMFTLTLPAEAPVLADRVAASILTPPTSLLAVPEDTIPLHRVRM
jgi:hypothetical protein